jgi:hypothetical protein
MKKFIKYNTSIFFGLSILLGKKMKKEAIDLLKKKL